MFLRRVFLDHDEGAHTSNEKIASRREGKIRFTKIASKLTADLGVDSSSSFFHVMMERPVQLG